MSRKAIPSVGDYARLRRGKSVSTCVLAVVMGCVVSCSAGLFDAVKNVASGVTDTLGGSTGGVRGICDDGGLGGCQGGLTEYKGGKYCQVHLARRQRRDAAIAQKQAEEAKLDADRANKKARAKAQYEQEKAKWAAADKKWREQSKKLPLWGTYVHDPDQGRTGRKNDGRNVGKSVQTKGSEGLIVRKGNSYRLYTGFTPPPVPRELIEIYGNLGEPKSGTYEWIAFEGNRYRCLFEDNIDGHSLTVAEPKGWGEACRACEAGKTADQLPYLWNVITNYCCLKWDVQAAERLDKYYHTLGDTNMIAYLIETVPYYSAVRNERLAREKTEKFHSGDEAFQYPIRSLCGDRPKLYRELTAGSSRDWCLEWLKKNASSVRAYDEGYDNNLLPGKHLAKGEVEAEVGEHKIVLKFDLVHDVLTKVRCSFGDDGVAQEALIGKYRAQFGEEAKVEETDLGIRKDDDLSSLPRTRKDQRELERMRFSNNGMERAVAQAVDSMDPFGGAGLDADAWVCYLQNVETVVTGKGLEVRARCTKFKGLAFLLNRTYNHLADTGRLVELNDWTKVPADAFYDDAGKCEIRNPACKDALAGGKVSIAATLKRAQEQNGKVFEVEISGTMLKAALAQDEQKRSRQQQEKAKAEAKKAEAAALNF